MDSGRDTPGETHSWSLATFDPSAIIRASTVRWPAVTSSRVTTGAYLPSALWSALDRDRRRLALIDANGLLFPRDGPYFAPGRGGAVGAAERRSVARPARGAGPGRNRTAFAALTAASIRPARRPDDGRSTATERPSWLARSSTWPERHRTALERRDGRPGDARRSPEGARGVAAVSRRRRRPAASNVISLCGTRGIVACDTSRRVRGRDVGVTGRVASAGSRCTLSGSRLRSCSIAFCGWRRVSSERTSGGQSSA